MASMGTIRSPLPKPANKRPLSGFSTNSFPPSFALAAKKNQRRALRALRNASVEIETHPIEKIDSTPTPAKKIDSWMEKSVPEIVRNLKKAPLLVQIYSDDDGDGSLKIRAEEAVPDEWDLLQSNWRIGNVKSPDGLIFVEELGHEFDGCDGIGMAKADEGVTRAWGICVQGRGVEAGPACYLLKTDRVCGGIGLGFCTHFCLVRVRTFKHSAFEQFKDAWLLRRYD